MNNVYEKVLEFKNKFPGTVAWRLKKHCEVIEGYINPDEYVLYAFCGQKNEKWYDLFTSCVIVLTNKRLLIGQKRVALDGNKKGLCERKTFGLRKRQTFSAHARLTDKEKLFLNPPRHKLPTAPKLTSSCKFIRDNLL